MNKLSLISVVVSNSSSQGNDNPQNNVKDIVIETAEELCGLYVQYNRTIDEATKYLKDEMNAFMGLDSIIIINKGIVEFCQNDDELVLVIGQQMDGFFKRPSVF